MSDHEIEFRRLARMRKRKRLTIVICLLLVIIALFILAYFMCTVKDVTVEGNEVYTDEQIISQVLPTSLDHNTAYLYYKYHFTKVEEIPFLDMVEVEITGLNSVRITVYEKNIVGYVESQGSYVYFDRSGTVINMSDEKREGIPQIYGLSFDYIHMYEVLPVEKTTVFNSLYNLSQLLDKHDLHPDSITVEPNQVENADYWILVFGQVEARLGPDENLENKVSRLGSLMNVLSGKTGILHLEHVAEQTDNVIFDKVEITADMPVSTPSPENSGISSWNIDPSGNMTPVEPSGGGADTGTTGVSGTITEEGGPEPVEGDTGAVTGVVN